MINVLDKIQLGMSIGMHGESHNFKNGGQKATKKAALKKKKHSQQEQKLTNETISN